MKKKTMITKIFFSVVFTLTVFKINSQIIYDYDGNEYSSITIGTQIWLKENLNVSHYNNGDSIPNVTNSLQWSGLNTGAFCDFNNLSSNSTIYGKLYNFFTTIDSRGICPVGWHVPTNTEWTTLTDYLGGLNIAGEEMKDTLLWNSPNIANNNSGFSAMPSGYRTGAGTFYSIGSEAILYSSTSFGSGTAYSRWLKNYSASVTVITNWIKTHGFCIRCLKDVNSNINNINRLDNINIFPNPANNELIFLNYESTYLYLYIYDVFGKCVLQYKLKSNLNKLDISYLNNGVYIVKLTSPDIDAIYKIIKE